MAGNTQRETEDQKRKKEFDKAVADGVAREMARREAADLDSKLTDKEKAFIRANADATANAVVRKLQETVDEQDGEWDGEDRRTAGFIDDLFYRGPERRKRR